MSTTVWTSDRPLETRQDAAASSSANDVSSIIPTPLFNFDYQSVIHPTPSCSDAPNAVLIAIQTTVTIPDYSRIYATPIDSFQPSYHALADGSLVTPVLIHDYMRTEAWLVVNGVFIMFFSMNVLLSANFIQRVKIKKKKLFYLLLASQVLGLVGTVPETIAHFHNSSVCTA